MEVLFGEREKKFYQENIDNFEVKATPENFIPDIKGLIDNNTILIECIEEK